MNDSMTRFLVVVCLVFIITMPIYLDYRENIFAMQHDYVQKVINNKVIWVKDVNCTNKNKDAK